MEKSCVLLVDDEEYILDLLEEILSDKELFALDRTVSSEKGLELCSKKKYKLICLDYRMPFLNGVEFVESLKKNDGPNKNSPIIFITANPESCTECVEQNKNIQILSKPVQIAQLASHLLKAMMVEE
jgi:CheY-like chemotaxis protein